MDGERKRECERESRKYVRSVRLDDDDDDDETGVFSKTIYIPMLLKTATVQPAISSSDDSVNTMGDTPQWS